MQKSNRLYRVASLLLMVLVSASMTAESIEEMRAVVEQEKKSCQAIESFAKNYDGGRFSLIACGPFSYLPEGAIFGVWVTSKNKETIGSGRDLAVAFTKAYLAELTTNKDTSKWYEYHLLQPKRFSGKLSVKNVGIKIAFWNEQVERPQSPYLAEIDFYGDMFRYYEADPKTHALRLVLEESYADALIRSTKSGL